MVPIVKTITCMNAARFNPLRSWPGANIQKYGCWHLKCLFLKKRALSYNALLLQFYNCITHTSIAAFITRTIKFMFTCYFLWRPSTYMSAINEHLKMFHFLVVWHCNIYRILSTLIWCNENQMDSYSFIICGILIVIIQVL